MQLILEMELLVPLCPCRDAWACPATGDANIVIWRAKSAMEDVNAGSRVPWGDGGNDNGRLVGERGFLGCLGDCGGGGADRLTVLERREPPAGIPVVSEEMRKLPDPAARRGVGGGGRLRFGEGVSMLRSLAIPNKSLALPKVGNKED